MDNKHNFLIHGFGAYHCRKYLSGVDINLTFQLISDQLAVQGIIKLMAHSNLLVRIPLQNLMAMLVTQLRILQNLMANFGEII